MDIYQKTIEFVNTSFKNKNIQHFERTVFWFEKFSPLWTDAHKIAAYAHDIERAFRVHVKYKDSYRDQNSLRAHEEEGAEIMNDFLQKEGFGNKDIEKVRHLISRHEEGGDREQDALMDADSVSFFETNAEMFVKEKVKIEGYAKIKEKLDWMFNRIKSTEAREYAQPNYEKWSAELEHENKE